jgi:subfamily B ATP-binding cassette protein MsbA
LLRGVRFVTVRALTLSTFATLKRLLRFARPHSGRASLAVFASILCAAATATYAFLVGPLLRAVLLGGEARWGAMRVDTHGWEGRLPLLLLLVALIKALAQLSQSGLMQSLAQRVLADVRAHLHSRLLRWPPRALETRHSGELLSRLTGDVGQLEFAVSTALGSYVKDSLQLLALLASCAIIDVKLFLLTFVALPLTILPVSRFARAVKRSARQTQGSLGRLTTLVAELLHNLPVVQGFGAQKALLAKFEAEQEGYLQEMKRSLFVRGAASPAVEFLGFLGVAVAIAWGARAVGHDAALAQRLLSFLAAQLLMYQPIKALSGTASQVAQGLAAAARLFELEDEPLPIDGGGEAGPLTRALELRGVRFTYGRGTDALKDVTLQVPAGKKVALVGSSGSGKSTLFGLVLRFLEPTDGEVLWDGAALSGLSRASLRAQLGWVPQEPVLFSGTIRDNLKLARAATDAELWEALRLAHAEGFVRARPLGLDEEVGERGARLSGGERQRLAIARAFLKRPSLLLLDEPTSALDAASEREVQAGLEELMRGRSSLVIAHRLSTVRDADLIYVLEEGSVVEVGSHDELVSRQGRYAELLLQGALAAA